MGMSILQIVIVLLLVINFLYWQYSKIESLWEKLIGCAFLTVAAGTPIIFTSLTRSVFEVSKLLNLKLALVWITAVILIKAIVTKERITIVKTSLHWPVLAYALVTTISALLSTNHYIAILGAYDRWDGLITELNYCLFIWYYIAFVKERRTFFWIIGALLGGAVLSAVYGIFQVDGLDFMRWSVDPKARVFGCINNPVHYAPYIMMHVPLLMGFIFYFLKTKNYQGEESAAIRHGIGIAAAGISAFLLLDTFIPGLYKAYEFFIANIVAFGGYILYVQQKAQKKLSLKILTLMILTGLMTMSLFLLYYVSGVLSFGRATWIGGSMAVAVLLYFLFSTDTKKVITDMVFMFISIALMNMFWVFKVQGAYGGKFIPVLLILAFSLVGFMVLDRQRLRLYGSMLLFVIYGALLQFCTVYWHHLLVNVLIILAILKYFVKDFQPIQKLAIGFMLIIFVAGLAIPAKDALITSIIPPQETITAGTEANILTKAKSYEGDFQKGTARSSMWLTALAAWKDHPVWGVGPGMVKEIYPKYRRSDYGRLEGGHNFTPDQFHNDYVSMLATRGLVGFIVYFIWFIPLCLYLMLKKIRSEGMQPANYILAGLLAGLFIHLGQTIFNFGVVATRILFYEFLCLALVLVVHDPFGTKNVEQKPEETGRA